MANCVTIFAGGRLQSSPGHGAILNSLFYCSDESQVHALMPPLRQILLTSAGGIKTMKLIKFWPVSAKTKRK